MNNTSFNKQFSSKMNECCRNFFDRESIQGEMNEPMQFCPYCGRQLIDYEFRIYNKFIKIPFQHLTLNHLEINYIAVGYYKQTIDFGILPVISDISDDEFNKMLEMLNVAIERAKEMRIYLRKNSNA